jgi:hypothetical protein
LPLHLPISKVMRWLVTLVLLMVLLIPSAIFLWHNSDLPQFGDIHDDSVYYVSAKSLAEGHYRIDSLPGQPAQTKYPPLYPLLLSVAWHLNPHFPENLPIAAWLSWLGLPAMLAALIALYPRLGISGWRKWLLLVLMAANPYVILFSATLLSELWFTALLAFALLLVEKSADTESSWGWVLAAGVVGGAAYLTRSAGIVLLASGVLYLWLLRKQRLKAAVFAAAMFPFVVGWTLWAHLHQLHTNDVALVYYIDYFRYELINVSLSNLHLVLWKNVDGLIWGLGSLVLPKVTDSLLMKILAVSLGVAMISGIVRLVRAGKAVHYAMYSAGAAFMLVIWHFPPNERFVLPLVPLAFAGLLTEMEHFAVMVRASLRHKDVSQRVAAALMAGVVVLLLSGSFALQGYVGSVFLKETAQQHRTRLVDHRVAYSWMRANLPPDAAVIAYNDPVLYLYTGRASISRPLPPALWYTEDHARAVELYRELPAYAHDHGADYIYYTTADLRRDMGDSDTTAIEKVIRTSAGLTPIYQAGIGTIYRSTAEEALRPTTAYTTPPSSTITSPGQVVAGR